ncbi:Hypothetical_protein [Hexamita inflata]|uniref:Hypothetical_protein n=1 Tax=Hexamita inflata TaxID=28002 RepID=A0AA86V099_9EUKA|nr:Hypothetical protein HINF_LOCUS59041 [Hexamita inflata]
MKNLVLLLIIKAVGISRQCLQQQSDVQQAVETALGALLSTSISPLMYTENSYKLVKQLSNDILAASEQLGFIITGVAKSGMRLIDAISNELYPNAEKTLLSVQQCSLPCACKLFTANSKLSKSIFEYTIKSVAQYIVISKIDDIAFYAQLQQNLEISLQEVPDQIFDILQSLFDIAMCEPIRLTCIADQKINRQRNCLFVLVILNVQQLLITKLIKLYQSNSEHITQAENLLQLLLQTSLENDMPNSNGFSELYLELLQQRLFDQNDVNGFINKIEPFLKFQPFKNSGLRALVNATLKLNDEKMFEIVKLLNNEFTDSTCKYIYTDLLELTVEEQIKAFRNVKCKEVFVFAWGTLTTEKQNKIITALTEEEITEIQKLEISKFNAFQSKTKQTQKDMDYYSLVQMLKENLANTLEKYEDMTPLNKIIIQSHMHQNAFTPQFMNSNLINETFAPLFLQMFNNLLNNYTAEIFTNNHLKQTLQAKSQLLFNYKFLYLAFDDELVLFQTYYPYQRNIRVSIIKLQNITFLQMDNNGIIQRKELKNNNIQIQITKHQILVTSDQIIMKEKVYLDETVPIRILTGNSFTAVLENFRSFGNDLFSELDPPILRQFLTTTMIKNLTNNQILLTCFKTAFQYSQRYPTFSKFWVFDFQNIGQMLIKADNNAFFVQIAQYINQQRDIINAIMLSILMIAKSLPFKEKRYFMLTILQSQSFLLSTQHINVSPIIWENAESESLIKIVQQNADIQSSLSQVLESWWLKLGVFEQLGCCYITNYSIQLKNYDLSQLSNNLTTEVTIKYKIDVQIVILNAINQILYQTPRTQDIKIQGPDQFEEMQQYISVPYDIVQLLEICTKNKVQYQKKLIQDIQKLQKEKDKDLSGWQYFIQISQKTLILVMFSDSIQKLLGNVEYFNEILDIFDALQWDTNCAIAFIEFFIHAQGTRTKLRNKPYMEYLISTILAQQSFDRLSYLKQVQIENENARISKKVIDYLLVKMLEASVYFDLLITMVQYAYDDVQVIITAKLTKEQLNKLFGVYAKSNSYCRQFCIQLITQQALLYKQDYEYIPQIIKQVGDQMVIYVETTHLSSKNMVMQLIFDNLKQPLSFGVISSMIHNQDNIPELDLLRERILLQSIQPKISDTELALVRAIHSQNTLHPFIQALSLTILLFNALRTNLNLQQLQLIKQKIDNLTVPIIFYLNQLPFTSLILKLHLSQHLFFKIINVLELEIVPRQFHQQKYNRLGSVYEQFMDVKAALLKIDEFKFQAEQIDFCVIEEFVFDVCKLQREYNKVKWFNEDKNIEIDHQELRTVLNGFVTKFGKEIDKQIQLIQNGDYADIIEINRNARNHICAFQEVCMSWEGLK